MRREHDTIVVEVLDQLSRLLQHQGPFHITILAVRANLPHDRLRGYLDELAAMGLVVREPVPMLTLKGRQFLDCYHAWLRIQKLYGLGVRTPRGAQTLAQAQALPAVRLAGPAPPDAAKAASDASPAPASVPRIAPRPADSASPGADVVADVVDVVPPHDPSVAHSAAGPSVRSGEPPARARVRHLEPHRAPARRAPSDPGVPGAGDPWPSRPA